MGKTRNQSIELQVEPKITIILWAMKQKRNASKDTPDLTHKNMGLLYLRNHIKR